MYPDKNPDPSLDTSKPGREEEVITNSDAQDRATNSDIHSTTNLPLKENHGEHETEGERRFKEGQANNNDTTPA
jgi:hypothetical protein